jgi:hypothetical protein
MRKNDIKRLKEIPEVLSATPEETIRALKILRGESFKRSFIIKALDEHVATIRQFRKKSTVTGQIIAAVRSAERLERKKIEWSKPSGNPVRDRLLEVGKYNPFSPDYVGDVIERREYPKHRPRFRTWGDI